MIAKRISLYFNSGASNQYYHSNTLARALIRTSIELYGEEIIETQPVGGTMGACILVQPAISKHINNAYGMNNRFFFMNYSIVGNSFYLFKCALIQHSHKYLLYISLELVVI